MRSRRASACPSSSRDELARFSTDLDDEYYEVLSSGSWLESKASEGGTASARVDEQLDRAREVLREQEVADAKT